MARASSRGPILFLSGALSAIAGVALLWLAATTHGVDMGGVVTVMFYGLFGIAMDLVGLGLIVTGIVLTIQIASPRHVNPRPDARVTRGSRG